MVWHTIRLVAVNVHLTATTLRVMLYVIDSSDRAAEAILPDCG